jgi:hypothetical protein
MIERIEFRYLQKRQIVFIALGCLLVASSWFGAHRHPDIVYRTVCWFGVGFFTLCSLVAAKRLITGLTQENSNPQMTQIDADKKHHLNDDNAITAKLNELYSTESSTIDPVFQSIQSRSVNKGDQK